MSDKELLEWAAKAAGIALYWPDESTFDEGWALPSGPLLPGSDARQKRDWKPWNPLTDDGDALRLAVKLGFVVNLSPREDCRGQTVVGRGSPLAAEPCHDGREVAARRAIVRAAASIGEAMKDKG